MEEAKMTKFFTCKHCGNLSGVIRDKGVPMVCCGEKMAELVPNTAEASTEKHLPSVSVKAKTCGCDCLSVQVGSTPHPMEDGHHIAFIYVETERGGQRKGLNTSEGPAAEFCLVDDRPVAVYAYCNLHGLWKTDWQ
jgi:superoxide reductase